MSAEMMEQAQSRVQSQAYSQAQGIEHRIEDIGLISVERQGMVALFDLVGRVLLTAARLDTHILMLSQSSSESNFCLAVPRSHAAALVDALRDELQPEITRRSIVTLHARHDVSLLSIRTNGNVNGGAVQLCEVLATQGINILALVQTRNGCSAIIEAVHKDRVVSALHEA